MKELLHHFGLFENRVQVGISKLHASNNFHGVLIGTNQSDSVKRHIHYVVDRPEKLASPNDPMVNDMVAQFAKLGVSVELIELNGSDAKHIYRVMGDKKVELVAKAPRFTY